jgi:hypothetical protein
MVVPVGYTVGPARNVAGTKAKALTAISIPNFFIGSSVDVIGNE